MTKLLAAKMIRETEKAALLECEVGPNDRRQMWFPKSQIEITESYIAAKDWILGKKAAELGIARIMLGFQAV